MDEQQSLNRYTLIIGDEFDPSGSLFESALATWIKHVTEYLDEHTPDNTRIDVRAPLGGDAQGLFHGTYPDLQGLASDIDDPHVAATLDIMWRAMEHAWDQVVKDNPVQAVVKDNDRNPQAPRVERHNPDGRGYRDHQVYDLPPMLDQDGHPDYWGALSLCPCPVHECTGTVVWYEAGFVPGYRVCMKQLGGNDVDGHQFDHDTIRHHFLASGTAETPSIVLINDVEDGQ